MRYYVVVLEESWFDDEPVQSLVTSIHDTVPGAEIKYPAIDTALYVSRTAASQFVYFIVAIGLPVGLLSIIAGGCKRSATQIVGVKGSSPIGKFIKIEFLPVIDPSHNLAVARLHGKKRPSYVPYNLEKEGTSNLELRRFDFNHSARPHICKMDVK